MALTPKIYHQTRLGITVDIYPDKRRGFALATVFKSASDATLQWEGCVYRYGSANMVSKEAARRHIKAVDLALVIGAYLDGEFPPGARAMSFNAHEITMPEILDGIGITA